MNPFQLVHEMNETFYEVLQEIKTVTLEYLAANCRQLTVATSYLCACMNYRSFGQNDAKTTASYLKNCLDALLRVIECEVVFNDLEKTTKKTLVRCSCMLFGSLYLPLHSYDGFCGDCWSCYMESTLFSAVKNVWALCAYTTSEEGDRSYTTVVNEIQLLRYRRAIVEAHRVTGGNRARVRQGAWSTNRATGSRTTDLAEATERDDRRMARKKASTINPEVAGVN